MTNDDVKDKMSQKFRNVCFTSFEIEKPVFCDKMNYMIVGKEVCPTSGKEHWQGYAEFKESHRMKGVKDMLGGDGVHIEPRRGTQDEAISYCMKGGAYESWGSVKQQGKRNDLSEVANAIATGKELTDVAAIYPEQYIKYHRGLAAFKAAIDKPKCTKSMRDIRVIVAIGPTNCGKSTFAHKLSKSVYSLNTGGANTWFNGYEGEEVLFIDEFDGGLRITDLLRICDKFPMNIEVKHGFTYAQWTTVVITSNITMDKWYPKANPEHLLAFQRRITDNIDMYAILRSTPRPPGSGPLYVSDVFLSSVPKVPEVSGNTNTDLRDDILKDRLEEAELILRQTMRRHK